MGVDDDYNDDRKKSVHRSKEKIILCRVLCVQVEIRLEKEKK